MKDTVDKTTIDAFARTRGRPRKYSNAAERQRVYRAKKKKKTIDSDKALTVLLKMAREQMERAKEEIQDPWLKGLMRGQANGLYFAWLAITDEPSEEEKSAFKEIFEK